jgi:hypothetical protein
MMSASSRAKVTDANRMIRPKSFLDKNKKSEIERDLTRLTDKLPAAL